MLPDPGTSKFGARWLIATVACSVIASLDGGFLMRWLSLSPIDVLHGQIWRLVTWPLVEVNVTPLLVTCIAITRFGDDLARAWGERRFQRFALTMAVGTGLVTWFIAAMRGGWYMSRLGGWAMGNALAIAWAREFPRESFDLFGIELSGRRLIAAVLVVSLAFGLYRGMFIRTPEIVASVLAFFL